MGLLASGWTAALDYASPRVSPQSLFANGLLQVLVVPITFFSIFQLTIISVLVSFLLSEAREGARSTC